VFFKPINIEIGALKVNNTDHGSAISLGTTKKIGRNVCGKKTQGFGQQMADYTFQAVNIHYVLDDDSLDQAAIKINK
jgi:hypothetical protein